MENCGYIVLAVNILEENGQYTAVCKQLDVATFGSTVEEAYENIINAVQVYLDGLEEEGLMYEVFEEKGIVIQKDNERKKPRPQASSGHFTRLLELPVCV